MNTLLIFTVGMAVWGLTNPLYAELDREAGPSLNLESIVQEYEPPSRGRSGSGIGGGTRFDGRTVLLPVS